MQKENGDWTYFASDIAYHYDKASEVMTRLLMFGVLITQGILIELELH